LALKTGLRNEKTKDFSIHLLDKKAFQNQAPHHLVNAALDKATMEN
jgi:hypothetical protein